MVLNRNFIAQIGVAMNLNSIVKLTLLAQQTIALMLVLLIPAFFLLTQMDLMSLFLEYAVKKMSAVI